MKQKIKILFIVVWVLASLFYGVEILFSFVAYSLIPFINYIYAASLIIFFIGSLSEIINEKAVLNNELRLPGKFSLQESLGVIAAVTAVAIFIGMKTSVIMITSLITFVTAIWILAKYKNSITKRLMINGVVVGIICSFAQYNFLPSFIVILIIAPLFFISASILNERFHFTNIYINQGNYIQAAKSFFIGCLLGLPIAFSNLIDVIATNPYTWITELWQPALAFNFVLLEEVWVRFFIITLVYVLVISKTDKKYIAVASAIIVSSAIFGFTHFPHVDLKNCINISIVYGLPLGVLFYKRDLETVVGYHFMIDLIAAIYSLTAYS